MFDKNRVIERFTKHGIPCPPTWAVPETANEVLGQLRERSCRTAYLKLNSGSSATGIAVIHALDEPPWALTTVTETDGDFFNT